MSSGVRPPCCRRQRPISAGSDRLGPTGHDVAVIISDTFGRPWRRGVTDVAIGCAGIRAVADLRGTTDALGRELMVTEVAVSTRSPPPRTS